MTSNDLQGLIEDQKQKKLQQDRKARRGAYSSGVQQKRRQAKSKSVSTSGNSQLEKIMEAR